MKRVILGLALTAMLVSCKKETKVEVKEATEAVESDIKENADTAMTKTETAIDTAKVKIGSAVEKSGEKADKKGEEMQKDAKKK